MNRTAGSAVVSDALDTIALRRIMGTPRRIRLYASSAAAARYAALYHPMRVWARGAHRLGLLAHRTGLASPRRSFTLADLGLHGEEAGFRELVVAESPEQERLLVVVNGDDRVRRVLKTGPATSSLRREASILASLKGIHLRGVLLPRLIERRVAGERLTLVINWLSDDKMNGRRVHTKDMLDVAIELARTGLTHGDLAPWNVVPAGSGLGLCDWEYARLDLIPGFDLAHYVAQSATLLGRWTPRECAELLVGDHRLGERYAMATGIAMSRVVDGIISYLDSPGEAAPRDERAVRLRKLIRGWIHTSRP